MRNARRILLVTMIAGLPLICLAAGRVKVYGGAVVSRVVSIQDGITFTANLKDVPPIIGDNIPVRVGGIDVPDLDAPSARVRELAFRARQATIAEFKGAKVIRLKNMRRDHVFRIIADVEIDGHSLAKALLDGGYAKPYLTGPRPRW